MLNLFALWFSVKILVCVINYLIEYSKENGMNSIENTDGIHAR